MNNEHWTCCRHTLVKFWTRLENSFSNPDDSTSKQLFPITLTTCLCSWPGYWGCNSLFSLEEVSSVGVMSISSPCWQSSGSLTVLPTCLKSSSNRFFHRISRPYSQASLHPDRMPWILSRWHCHLEFCIRNETCLPYQAWGGGGNIVPLTFERFSSKNCLSQWSTTFWQFLNMYILWLHLKKNCQLYPDRRAERGFKLAGQDMLCIFWTFLHFFLSIILILSC